MKVVNGTNEGFSVSESLFLTTFINLFFSSWLGSKYLTLALLTSIDIYAKRSCNEKETSGLEHPLDEV